MLSVSFLPDPLIVRSSLLSRFFYSRVVWHKHSSQLMWAETSRQPCWNNSTTTLARMCHMSASMSNICIVIAGGDVAYINHRDDDGQTALFLACCMRSYGIVSVLLKVGADPNIYDKYGRFPLHEAIEWRCNNIMSLLLNAKALVSVADIDGTTPLMLAAEEVFCSGIRKLLEHGADINAKDSVDQNVFDYIRLAEENGRQVDNVFELLDSHRSKLQNVGQTLPI